MNKNYEMNENLYSHNVYVQLAITLVLLHSVVKFACSIGFSAMADRMVWPPSLSRDRK